MGLVTLPSHNKSSRDGKAGHQYNEEQAGASLPPPAQLETKSMENKHDCP